MDIKKIIEEIKNGNAVILDVRTSDEWNNGYVDGAIHFDLEKIMRGEIPDIDSGKIIYTYCRSGGRANMALEILHSKGFSNVVCLGGYLDWKENGGPVVE